MLAVGYILFISQFKLSLIKITLMYYVMAYFCYTLIPTNKYSVNYIKLNNALILSKYIYLVSYYN